MEIELTHSNQKLALLTAWQTAAQPILDMLQGEGGWTWPTARESYVSQMEALLAAPDGVTFDAVSLDGVPAIVVTPEHVAGNRAVFYIHGGGYVHGGPAMYKSLTARLAKRLHARVYLPDYRQAPEHPFPGPIEDTFRAYRALFTAGHDGREIAIAGDSAGGALVVTIMRWARNAGVPLPAAGVAMSPWADITHAGLSAKTRDGLDPIAGTRILDLLARTFLGDALATHADASPVFADVHGLAPTLIQMGENEVMLDGGITLASRLAEQRVRTTLEVWPGMFHVWPVFAGHLPEADEALDNAVAFIEREFGRSQR